MFYEFMISIYIFLSNFYICNGYNDDSKLSLDSLWNIINRTLWRLCKTSLCDNIVELLKLHKWIRCAIFYLCMYSFICQILCFKLLTLESGFILNIYLFTYISNKEKYTCWDCESDAVYMLRSRNMLGAIYCTV